MRACACVRVRTQKGTEGDREGKKEIMAWEGVKIVSPDLKLSDGNRGCGVRVWDSDVDVMCECHDPVAMMGPCEVRTARSS